jgi:ABC-type sugar transport system permease subunit
MSHSGVMPMTQARSRNFHRFYDINGWCFVLASLTLVLLFMIYPILNSLWLSLHSGKGVIVQFVGFGNITRLMNDQVFITALTNTLIFLIVQVPLMILLSLATASCLNLPTLPDVLLSIQVPFLLLLIPRTKRVTVLLGLTHCLRTSANSVWV